MPKTTAAPAAFLSVKNLLLLCCCTLMAGWASCKSDKNSAAGANGKPAGRPNAVTADVYVVQPQDFAPVYTVAGRLLPNEEVTLMPEMPGRITGIFFSEGGTVSKGQTLITLNDADLRAGIQKLEAQRSLQNTLSSRQAELVKIGGISRQEYDATQTSVASINADIAGLRASLARMKVVAPFSGKIGLRNVSVGAVIGTGTAIATLQQINPLKLDFSLPDQYRTTVYANKLVPFALDALADSFSAQVYAVEPGNSGATGTVSVRARVQNPNGRLSPGSIATVRVAVGSGGQAILVPTQCVVPTTRDRKVFKVSNGKVSPVTVITGARTNTAIQILNGLSAGDTILASGMMQAKPGMSVKVRKTVE